MSDEASARSTSRASVLKPAAPEPRVFRILSGIEISVACILLSLIFITVLWQILGRYVHQANWVGAGEIARYSLVMLTFIMVGYLIGRNGHIVIQVIDYVVKGRAFIVIKMVSATLLAVICIVLAWEAISLITAAHGRTTTVIRIPIFVLYFIPLFAMLSSAARSIYRIFTADQEERANEMPEAD